MSPKNVRLPPLVLDGDAKVLHRMTLRELHVCLTRAMRVAGGDSSEESGRSVFALMQRPSWWPPELPFDAKFTAKVPPQERSVCYRHLLSLLYSCHKQEDTLHLFDSRPGEMPRWRLVKDGEDEYTIYGRFPERPIWTYSTNFQILPLITLFARQNEQYQAAINEQSKSSKKPELVIQTRSQKGHDPTGRKRTNKTAGRKNDEDFMGGGDEEEDNNDDDEDEDESDFPRATRIDQRQTLLSPDGSPRRVSIMNRLSSTAAQRVSSTLNEMPDIAEPTGNKCDSFPCMKCGERFSNRYDLLKHQIKFKDRSNCGAKPASTGAAASSSTLPAISINFARRRVTTTAKKSESTDGAGGRKSAQKSTAATTASCESTIKKNLTLFESLRLVPRETLDEYERSIEHYRAPKLRRRVKPQFIGCQLPLSSELGRRLFQTAVRNVGRGKIGDERFGAGFLPYEEYVDGKPGSYTRKGEKSIKNRRGKNGNGSNGGEGTEGNRTEEQSTDRSLDLGDRSSPTSKKDEPMDHQPTAKSQSETVLDEESTKASQASTSSGDQATTEISSSQDTTGPTKKRNGKKSTAANRFVSLYPVVYRPQRLIRHVHTYKFTPGEYRLRARMRENGGLSFEARRILKDLPNVEATIEELTAEDLAEYGIDSENDQDYDSSCYDSDDLLVGPPGPRCSKVKVPKNRAQMFTRSQKNQASTLAAGSSTSTSATSTATSSPSLHALEKIRQKYWPNLKLARQKIVEMNATKQGTTSSSRGGGRGRRGRQRTSTRGLVPRRHFSFDGEEEYERSNDNLGASSAPSSPQKSKGNKPFSPYYLSPTRSGRGRPRREHRVPARYRTPSPSRKDGSRKHKNRLSSLTLSPTKSTANPTANPTAKPTTVNSAPSSPQKPMYAPKPNPMVFLRPNPTLAVLRMTTNPMVVKPSLPPPLEDDEERRLAEKRFAGRQLAVAAAQMATIARPDVDMNAQVAAMVAKILSKSTNQQQSKKQRASSVVLPKATPPPPRTSYPTTTPLAALEHGYLGDHHHHQSYHNYQHRDDRSSPASSTGTSSTFEQRPPLPLSPGGEERVRETVDEVVTSICYVEDPWNPYANGIVLSPEKGQHQQPKVIKEEIEDDEDEEEDEKMSRCSSESTIVSAIFEVPSSSDDERRRDSDDGDKHSEGSTPIRRRRRRRRRVYELEELEPMFEDSSNMPAAKRLKMSFTELCTRPEAVLLGATKPTTAIGKRKPTILGGRMGTAVKRKLIELKAEEKKKTMDGKNGGNRKLSSNNNKTNGIVVTSVGGGATIVENQQQRQTEPNVSNPSPAGIVVEATKVENKDGQPKKIVLLPSTTTAPTPAVRATSTVQSAAQSLAFQGNLTRKVGGSRYVALAPKTSQPAAPSTTTRGYILTSTGPGGVPIVTPQQPISSGQQQPMGFAVPAVPIRPRLTNPKPTGATTAAVQGAQPTISAQQAQQVVLTSQAIAPRPPIVVGGGQQSQPVVAVGKDQQAPSIAAGNQSQSPSVAVGDRTVGSRNSPIIIAQEQPPSQMIPSTNPSQGQAIFVSVTQSPLPPPLAAGNRQTPIVAQQPLPQLLVGGNQSQISAPSNQRPQHFYVFNGNQHLVLSNAPPSNQQHVVVTNQQPQEPQAFVGQQYVVACSGRGSVATTLPEPIQAAPLPPPPPARPPQLPRLVPSNSASSSGGGGYGPSIMSAFSETVPPIIGQLTTPHTTFKCNFCAIELSFVTTRAWPSIKYHMKVAHPNMNFKLRKVERKRHVNKVVIEAIKFG